MSERYDLKRPFEYEGQMVKFLMLEEPTLGQMAEVARLPEDEPGVASDALAVSLISGYPIEAIKNGIRSPDYFPLNSVLARLWSGMDEEELSEEEGKGDAAAD